MKVRIVKNIEVDNVAVVQIAAAFLEWLEKQGFELVHSKEEAFEECYEELAQRWVNNAGEI